MEFEGVVVEDTSDLHTKAWLALADEEGKPRPLLFALKRAEGMKNEQARRRLVVYSCTCRPIIVCCKEHKLDLCGDPLRAQVVQEVFCWSRNPVEVRRLCARKEELYAGLLGNHYPPVVPGVPVFLDTLLKHNVRRRSPTTMPAQDFCRCCSAVGRGEDRGVLLGQNQHSTNTTAQRAGASGLGVTSAGGLRAAGAAGHGAGAHLPECGHGGRRVPRPPGP